MQRNFTQKADQWECRPKRKIVKPCLDYSQMLLREEEQALKKALYVSLKEVKSDPESTNQFESRPKKAKLEEGVNKPDTPQDGDLSNKAEKSFCKEKSKEKLVKRRRRKKVVKNKEDNKKSANSVSPEVTGNECKDSIKKTRKSGLSLKKVNPFVFSKLQPALGFHGDKNGHRRFDDTLDPSRSGRQLQAQRKFATSQPCSPSSLLLQQIGTPVSERPKTEDFIKFLCLRGTASLPKELEFFNSPILPPSPLSSEEDEYLPVSPFFKRQVVTSIGASKSRMQSFGDFQFDERSHDDSPPVEKVAKTPARRLSKFFDDTDNSSVASSPCQNINTSTTKDSTNNASANVMNEDNVKANATAITTASRTAAATAKGTTKTTGKEAATTTGKEAATTTATTTKSLEVAENPVSVGLKKKRTAKGQSKVKNTISDPLLKPIDNKLTKPPTAITTERTASQPKTSEGLRISTPYLSDSSSQESMPSTLKTSSKLTGNIDGVEAVKNSGTKRKSRVRGKKSEISALENALEQAPVFRPMEQEFRDPMKYIKKIMPFILKFGICILVPPAGWQPANNISDDIRFGTKLQHIHKMRARTPETTKFLRCLQKCLGDTSDLMEAVPQIGSCEVDLLQMSKVFASMGGIAKVNTPRKWHKAADTLHLPKNAQGRINKLQDIYYKYVLPFDILSTEEKDVIKTQVEEEIKGKTSDFKLHHLEFKGRSASISAFHRIASNAQEMYGRGQTSIPHLEDDFWDVINTGRRHVASISGDIDTMNYESSFHTTRKKSAWNLSSLPQLQGSLLKHLDVVPGLTTSSLKFSSLFSTSGWQKAEDDLLKIEYLHTGASKVWYAVSSYTERPFLKSMEKMTSEQITEGGCTMASMISPLELDRTQCVVSRVVQNEGQFVLCLPNVYHCTMGSGYCLAESCYFAQVDWMKTRLATKTKTLTPSMKFPAEMVILNYAKCEVEKSKKSEETATVLELIKVIRETNKDCMQKLSESCVLMSTEVPQGRYKRVAVGWEMCSECNRPLFPLLIWQDSSFFCMQHAFKAIENSGSDAAHDFRMFTHWTDAQLRSLMDKLEEIVTEELDAEMTDSVSVED